MAEQVDHADRRAPAYLEIEGEAVDVPRAT
jgi:hypothetical protein